MLNRVLCRLCYSLFDVFMFLLRCRISYVLFLCLFFFLVSFLFLFFFLVLFLFPDFFPPTAPGPKHKGNRGASNRGSESEADTQGGKADPKGRYKCASQKEDTTPTATRLDLLWTKRKSREHDRFHSKCSALLYKIIGPGCRSWLII